jgi:hypothetical protein
VLPPKADIGERDWDVRFVPKADILRSMATEAVEAMALSLNDDLQLAGRNEMTHRRVYCPTPR